MASVVQTLTLLSASTNTNIHTATGDENLRLRIVNDTTGDALVNISISTSSATPNSAGKVLPDSFIVAADSVFVEKISMNTANEFLVMQSSVIVSTIVDGVKL
jgi:hypothetical protein